MRRLARSVVLLLFLTAAAAHATTIVNPVYTVTSVADVPDFMLDGVCETAPGNGVCTLRAAVMEANNTFFVYYATINLPAGIYSLSIPIGTPDDQTNGDLNFTGADVVIQGAGAAVTTIDANFVDRAIHMAPGAYLTITGVRITNGRPPDLPGRPGGGRGGAIFDDQGYLTLMRCLVDGNATSGGRDGGGIYTSGGSSLDILESTFRLNHAAGGSGGAIYAYATATSVTRSTLSENTATAGAGIYQSVEPLQVTNSTIGLNDAGVSGGGIYLFQVTGTNRLNNVTVIGNGVDADQGGTGTGGGIYVYQSSVTLSNSILNNLNDSTHDDDDCGFTDSASITSNGYNIISAPGPCTITGAYTQASVLVGNPSDNGGPTKTYALQPGSPGIDVGNPGGCTDPLGATLTTDQRGVKRPIGTRCDLGSVEVEPKGDANGDGFVNVSDVFYLINFLFAGGQPPLGRANVDGLGGITVADVFYLINFLFAGGPAPV